MVKHSKRYQQAASKGRPGASYAASTRRCR